jgi:hypothetical protein
VNSLVRVDTMAKYGAPISQHPGHRPGRTAGDEANGYMQEIWLEWELLYNWVRWVEDQMPPYRYIKLTLVEPFALSNL